MDFTWEAGNNTKRTEKESNSIFLCLQINFLIKNKNLMLAY